MPANRFQYLVLSCLTVVLLNGTTCSTALAGKFNRNLSVGDKAPDWSGLTGTDGKQHSLEDYKDSELVVAAFMCNHCPVAKMYEERFVEFTKEYKPKGVAFVGISCSLFPADGLEKMKQRAAEKNFNFDYVADPSQNVGREYGATATPQVFVLDKKRRVAYMGAFDDSMNPDKVERNYVRDAVEALLVGKTPGITETRQFGCAIEYQPEKETAEARKPPAVDVTLKVVGPEQYKSVIAKQKGKVVVVDFWATWCIPCLKNFSHTVEWSRKYPAKDLVVISMSLDDVEPEAKEQALKFLKKQNATILNLMSSLGGEEKAMEAFEIDGGSIPHFKIYDRKGKVVKTFGGDIDNPFKHQDVEAALVEVLNKK